MEYLVIALIILAQLSHKKYRFSALSLLLLINPFLYAISVPSFSMILSDLDSCTLYQKDILLYGLVFMAFRELSIDFYDVIVILLAYSAVHFRYLGMGDLLLITIGAVFTNPYSLWLATFISSITATLYALATKKRRIPFGPFIIAGQIWVWLTL